METNAQFSMVLLPGARRESWQGLRQSECWRARDGIPKQRLSDRHSTQQGEKKGQRSLKEQVSSPRGPYGDTALEVRPSLRLQEGLWRQREACRTQHKGLGCAISF